MTRKTSKTRTASTAGKRRKKGRAVQTEFEFRDRDGRRHRSGRPRNENSGVRHTPRTEFVATDPLHVTLKIREGLPSMRKRPAFRSVLRAFAGGKLGVEGVGGFRLTQFSVLRNHMHLMIEADSREHLTSGMTGLATRIALALNKIWGRKGRVFEERYHKVVLSNPNQVRNALNYILHNGRKHGIPGLERGPDPCSSARWFQGWKDAISDSLLPGSLELAQNWLLRKGWRRRGLLLLDPSG
jgi:REP element-mobilizing transposase RayT